jgi:hypothetical protein
MVESQRFRAAEENAQRVAGLCNLAREARSVRKGKGFYI